ncbi:MAG: hypothetical protein IJV69_06670 [Kiritimatiellae bacterium]|nr:hypothetical protein [Kiritimatiellia bacterium]
MAPHREDYVWERSRQYVPNKRVSMLRLLRWRKMRRSNRRRKSVLAFWWPPVVTIAIAGVSFFFAFLALPKAKRDTDKRLPRPGIYVVSTSQETLTALMRQENVRRIALALSDDDVGISLEQVLPEPQKRALIPIQSPTVPNAALQSEAFMADAFLPPMATEKNFSANASGVKMHLAPALLASQFEVVLPDLPTGTSASTADFWVTLNAVGAVDEVLRFAPVGEETAWLKALRKALFMGRGNAAAQGLIRIQWETEVRE